MARITLAWNIETELLSDEPPSTEEEGADIEAADHAAGEAAAAFARSLQFATMAPTWRNGPVAKA